MAQLETRIKKLEAQMVPLPTTELVIFRVSIPAVNGKVCPEYEKRGIQTATCDGATIYRDHEESEKAFKDRVTQEFRKQGQVVSALLD